MEHPIAQHIEIGKIGEDIACNYLKSKGYKVIERNFRRKWGEIDIVCKKKTKIFNTHFLHNTVFNSMLSSFGDVLHRTRNVFKKSILEDKIIFVEVKTLKGGDMNPEDNVTLSKQKKLIRTCELYLSDKKFNPDTDWQIDVVAVRLDKGVNNPEINHIESAVYYS